MRHWWDSTISATRPIIKPIHVFYRLVYMLKFQYIHYFSRFIYVTLRYTQDFIYVAYIFGCFEQLLEADVSLTSV